MRCKNCPRTTKQNQLRRAKCWKKWGLCGECAVKLHPEEYSESQRKSWTSMPMIRETPKISGTYAWSLKRKARMHTHCLQCNSSLEGKHYNTKYCSNECKKIAFSSRNAKDGRKEYFKTWYKKKRPQILEKSLEKDCELCGRNIHTVNPNKKLISKFCGDKCMQLYNHMTARKKTPEEINVRVPLLKYLELLRDGHIEQ